MVSDQHTPLKVSRFAHFVTGSNDYVGMLNALDLGVVVVTSQVADFLRHRKTLDTNDLEALTAQTPTLVDELCKRKLLVPRDAFEVDDLKPIRDHLTHLPVGILYLLLTDSCNIRCGYCYFEGAIPKHHKFSKMSTETAKRGVDLFTRLMPRAVERGIEEPQIILYGGEPLLNWPVMREVLNYVEGLLTEGKLPPATSVVINTNATLITEAMANELSRLPFVTAAVSIDGPRDIHDLQRKDPVGRGTFGRVDRGLRLLQEAGLNVGLCCTLASHNLDRAEDILVWMHETYGVSSLGFNVLIGPFSTETQDYEAYATRVSEKLVSCFRIAREIGVYEDRFMRKVKSFVDGRLYLHDCGGCGQQIVVSPDGYVGVCQAYCGTKRYFTPLVEGFDPDAHPFWLEWRSRSPITLDPCIDCIALGNCGGGCPYSAEVRHGSIWALDDIFCVFSKQATAFLVDDLITQMLKTRRVHRAHNWHMGC